MTHKAAITMSALLLALLPLAATQAASAQTATVSPKSDSVHSDPTTWPIHTFFLKTDDDRTMSDVTVALRNALSPGTSVTSVFTQKALVLRLNPADIPTVEKILSDIDHPRKAYRVTYTLSEMDDDRRVGTQHFAMVMISGQEARLKQGSKVPIAAGTSGMVPTQINYQDVGIMLDATLLEMGTAGQLRFDVEQSGIAPGASGLGAENPILRQTSLKGEATLIPGKPLMIGSISIPDSTRRLDIEVLMNPLP